MSKRLMRSAAAPFAVALLLLASGAPSAAVTPSSESTNQQGAPTNQNPPEPLGSTDSNGENNDIPNASAEIMSLQKSISGDLISVTIRVTNNGDKDIHDNAFGNTVFRYREDLFSGVTLLDPSGQSRYNPIMDEEGYCSCSGYAPRAPYAPFVSPGESIDYWAMYSLPGDISSVDVEIPGFDPIKNVPVG